MYILIRNSYFLTNMSRRENDIVSRAYVTRVRAHSLSPVEKKMILLCRYIIDIWLQ